MTDDPLADYVSRWYETTNHGARHLIDLVYE